MHFFETLTQSCCEADEIVIYDINEYEIPVEIKSFWMEENLCFINTTEKLENLAFPYSDDIAKQKCSILTFDDSEGTFQNHFLEIDIKDCFEKPCSLYIDESLKIFNGTTIICDESSHVGIVTKSKSIFWGRKLTLKIDHSN